MIVLKSTALTKAVLKDILSTFDRNVRILKGLPEGVRSKVFEYGSESVRRMLQHDLYGTDSELMK